MTSFFAGRTSLRQLHQTVQRNIVRTHRSNIRHESSKSQNARPSRNASTVASESAKAQTPFSGSYWAWVEPIKIPFRAYSGMQARSPLLTQFETTLVIYFLGDLAAQTVQTNAYTEARYEPIRGFRAMIIGGISSIPSYKFFLWLGRHFNYASHLKSLAVKIVVSQTFFTPIFNTYFFSMQTLLSGGSLKDAKERVIATVPVSWANSWKLWPAVTAFNFTFISPHNRSVFAGVIAIGWQTYLSWLNRAAEQSEKKEKVKKGSLTRDVESAAEKAARQVVKT